MIELPEDYRHDAAGAIVFRAAEEDGRGILGSALYGDGNHKDIL